MYIEDMINAMCKIENYTREQKYEDFIKNDLVIDGVIRNLEIIGEAAKNVPANVRNRHLEIPWKRMIGLRNIIGHEYFGINLSIIWRIVTKNIPETKPLIESLLDKIEKNESSGG